MSDMKMNQAKQAAFEDFKFKIGDFVRLKAQRIEVGQTLRQATELGKELMGVGGTITSATHSGTAIVAMVIHRKVVQGFEGFFNYYYVKGMSWADNVWEEELEPVSE